MVDINLLKDDDDEKGYDASRPDDDMREDIGGEINFDDDLTDPVLEDDDLLGEMDDIPEMESDETGFDAEDDYSYVSSGAKKAPLWLWGLLGLICIGAALYLFVIHPRLKKQPVVVQQPTRKPLITQTKPDSTQTQITAVGDETTEEIPPLHIPVTFEDSQSIIPAAAMASASKAIVEDLARSGQFATLFLSGDRVYVEYISKTPGVTKAMGHRIQTLLGLSGYTASPEERHRTAGEITYWGVISGRLPAGSAQIDSSEAGRYQDVQSFVNAVKTQLKQYRLTAKGSQSLTNAEDASSRQKCVRIEIEGNRQDALSYLASLPQFKGNFGLTKLVMAPVSYSDFSASRVKMVLDFLLQFG